MKKAFLTFVVVVAVIATFESRRVEACGSFVGENIHVGENFEIAFDRVEKKILRGWRSDMDIPDLASLYPAGPDGNLLFAGRYPLCIVMEDASGGKKMEAELIAGDETCTYSSAFLLAQNKCQATGSWLSNFGVSYPGVLSNNCGGQQLFTYSYISDMTGDDQMYLTFSAETELGLITSDSGFSRRGVYVNSVPAGSWYLVGIQLGNEWMPMRGMVKTVQPQSWFESKMGSVSGSGVRTDNGGLINFTINIDAGYRVWLHEGGDILIMWKDMGDGSTSGFFFILRQVE